MLRSPIVSVLGHVDHGKTSLLDSIRGTSINLSEPGQITQYISASFVPADVIKKACGELLNKFKVKLMVPGLLFVDTPGHESFVTLRKRGGSVADLAILVIDINEGFQQQTDESLSILKEFKTPFAVALTKIDKIPGWFSHEGSFLESFSKQRDDVRDDLEKKLYQIVSQLSERGFNSERFDRIENFTKQISIVPTSGKTGEGVPELLMVLTGLSQQFLKERLEVSEVGRGTVLEVKDVKGFGTTIDVILYDGSARRGNWIVIGGKEPLTSKIKALLIPRPLQELRAEKQFESVEKVSAAVGVKIASPDLENVTAGSPVLIIEDEEDIEQARSAVQKEIEEVEFARDVEGVVLKADTLGGLEALIKLTKEAGIPIRKAEVGKIARQDIVELQNVKDEIRKVVLAFNISPLDDAQQLAKDLGIEIFHSNIIYRILEEYKEWSYKRKEREIEEKMEMVVWPGKIRLLPKHTFRESKPAIVGVEVVAGRIKSGTKLLDEEGNVVGEIKEVQNMGKAVQEARQGERVAVSIEGPIVGRQIEEGDVLTVYVPEESRKILLTELREKLNADEIELLK